MCLNTATNLHKCLCNLWHNALLRPPLPELGISLKIFYYIVLNLMLIYSSLDLKLTTTFLFSNEPFSVHLLHLCMRYSRCCKEKVSIHCREVLHFSPCSRVFMKQRVQRESSQAQAFIYFQNNGLIWFSWLSSSWSLSRLYSCSFGPSGNASYVNITQYSEVRDQFLWSVWTSCSAQEHKFFSTTPSPNHTLGLSSLVSLGIFWVSVK